MDAMKKAKFQELPDWQKQTAVIMFGNDDLRIKLLEAFGTDRFFLTLCCLKDKTIWNYWLLGKYAINDIRTTLEHLKNDFIAKEKPGKKAKKKIGLLCEKITTKQLPEILKKALLEGSLFITISYQKKYSPEDPHDYKHYWRRLGEFPKDYVIKSLTFINDDFVMKYDPGAVLESEEWH